jgi:hypothetical protein
LFLSFILIGIHAIAPIGMAAPRRFGCAIRTELNASVEK